MKKYLAVMLSILGSNLGSALASDPTIEIFSSIAPHQSSLYFSEWQSNALYALQNGLTSYGDPTLPSYYYVLSIPIEAKQNTVTSGFNSWDGQADPTGVFSGERGMGTHFGTVITGDGTISGQLSASMIKDIEITDSSGELDTTFGAVTYNASLIGLNYGSDRTKGTSDDFTITSGSNTQVVDEIYWRGPRVSWLVNLSSPGLTNQDKLDNEFALHLDADIMFSFRLDLPDAPGVVDIMASSAVDVIPEPSVAVLALVGAVGVFGFKRKRH